MLSSRPPEQRAISSMARILCVDDSPTMRAVYALAFTHCPNVRVVDSPRAALAAVEANERSGAGTWDAFILDVKMQPIDGFALAERLRALPRYKVTPLLFLSSIAESPEHVRRARALGGTLVSKRAGAGNQVASLVVEAIRKHRAATLSG